MTHYRWIAEPPVDDTGLAADLELGFPGLAEAEDWLSTFYDDLRQAGAEQVTLLEGERPILGPMALQPAAESATSDESDGSDGDKPAG